MSAGEPVREARAGHGLAGERGGRERFVARALLALAFAFVLFARLFATFSDEHFDAKSADGLLRSDPALLYYVTERVIDGGGLPPGDFRRDPRVAWPAPADLPAMETVGQEFLVAWGWLAFGRASGLPLHVFAALLMSLIASLATLGVYGLARELGARPLLAALGAWLYAGIFYNYRTVGVILIREDLALPLFALHLWLAARALRVRTPASALLAGLAGVAALATWHAMSFVVLLEAAALLAWFVRSGETPFATGAGKLALLPYLAGGLLVPVLAAKGFLLSPAFGIALALLAVELVDRRGAWRPWKRVLLGLGALALLLALARLAGGQEDYAHVDSLLVAKLRSFGRIPDDPSGLDFGARLLWQGPFATASGFDLTRGLGIGGPLIVAALVAALPGLLRSEGPRPFLVAALFGAGSLIAGWLVARTLVLPGLVAPALGAALAARLPRPRLALAALALLAAGQLGLLVRLAAALHPRYVSWYAAPGEITVELAELVRWARRSLPPDAPLMGDYVTSTALLAHNENPIAVQPKYETADTRRRIEEFARAYLRGTTEDVRRLCLEYRCRYLVVDRIGDWLLLGYPAGYPLSRLRLDSPPPPGTAAAAFGATDERALRSIPGFRLVYRAPDGFYWDYYRVYEVLPAEGG